MVDGNKLAGQTIKLGRHSHNSNGGAQNGHDTKGTRKTLLLVPPDGTTKKAGQPQEIYIRTDPKGTAHSITDTGIAIRPIRAWGSMSESPSSQWSGKGGRDWRTKDKHWGKGSW